MKKFFIIAGMLSVGAFYAQQNGSVGINATPSGATLDVSISTESGVAESAGQGVAVPRVSKERLSKMSGTITESALVYVNDVDTAVTGTASDRIADVDAVGFYYFDNTKWVKLGGNGAGSSSTTWEGIRIGSGAIHNVTTAAATLSADTAKKTWFVYTDFNGSVKITLPTLTTGDAGKVISFFKKQQGNISFVDANGKSDSDTGSNLVGATGVTTNRAKTLMWTGSVWVPITY